MVGLTFDRRAPILEPLDLQVHDPNRRFPVAEIFPAIQGEGRLIGCPTIFVRFGGCDFRCSWCDSMYAVEPSNRAKWESLTIMEILTRVCALAYGSPQESLSRPFGVRPMVTLTGGNPALYRLDDLLTEGMEHGLLFALETQGSIPKPWMQLLSILTLSPKGPSAGMGAPNWVNLIECVRLGGEAATLFKIVVADERDYEFAREVRDHFPHVPIYLQPCNTNPGSPDPAQYIGLFRQIESWVLRDRWWRARLTFQQHVIAWDNEPGK